MLRAGYGLNYLPPDLTMEGGMFALVFSDQHRQQDLVQQKEPEHRAHGATLPRDEQSLPGMDRLSRPGAATPTSC